MADDIQIDGKAFLRRVSTVLGSFKVCGAGGWGMRRGERQSRKDPRSHHFAPLLFASQDTTSAPDESLHGCDAVAILMGGQNEEVTYSKTAALHVSRQREETETETETSMMHPAALQ